MRALVQRVDWAEVQVEGKVIGRIEGGLLVYVAVGQADTPAQAEWLAEKVANLRIFEDEQGKLNKSVLDMARSPSADVAQPPSAGNAVSGEHSRGRLCHTSWGVLAISNFTLLADARKGRRPTFEAAAGFEAARPLHEAFLEALAKTGVSVATGQFGADMRIRSQAAGPVNVVIDNSSQSPVASSQ